MHLATYLRFLQDSETDLAAALQLTATGHADEADVFHVATSLRQFSEAHAQDLTPLVERYQSLNELSEPERLRHPAYSQVRQGGVGLLRDLQDLFLLATLVQSTWTVVEQAAQGCRDAALVALCGRAKAETDRQLAWLQTRIKQAAPQALLASTS